MGLDERGDPFAQASEVVVALRSLGQLLYRPKDKKSGLGNALFKQVVKPRPELSPALGLAAACALSPRYKSRSPFSALSGAGDFYLTPSDLSKNCRPCVQTHHVKC